MDSDKDVGGLIGIFFLIKVHTMKRGLIIPHIEAIIKEKKKLEAIRWIQFVIE